MPRLEIVSPVTDGLLVVNGTLAGPVQVEVPDTKDSNPLKILAHCYRLNQNPPDTPPPGVAELTIATSGEYTIPSVHNAVGPTPVSPNPNPDNQVVAWLMYRLLGETTPRYDRSLPVKFKGKLP